ncbi:hypothetical protein O181_090377 [Austropuccinia psidii MF-1]|uniref:Reverse transcriptase n=1 Tax=Austropuccinia psidii MF-1 TaxID=1389203 RepID=A0A9Q3IV91_9BASI|nr:hypothetical protein [Austropuccinia psidii MF-1]
MYVSYHQDDWNTWPHLAEFSYNNSDHSSTKQLAFFTVYERDPQSDSVQITQDTPAGKLSTKIQSVQKDVKRELEVAINRFKRYADKSRASHLFSILVTWYGFLPRTSNQPDPPKNCLKMAGSFSNLEESKYSCLPPQASISMEIHPPSLPYFTFGTSQDINNPKLASRASSSNHH